MRLRSYIYWTLQSKSSARLVSLLHGKNTYVALHPAFSRTLTFLLQPYALAIVLISIFTIFIIELVAFRWGTAKLAQLGIAHDPHGHGISHDPDGHGIGAHAAHGPELEQKRERTTSSGSSATSEQAVTVAEKDDDLEAALNTVAVVPREDMEQPHSHGHDHEHGGSHSHGTFDESTATQIVGIAILEFGVVLHRSVRFFALQRSL